MSMDHAHHSSSTHAKHYVRLLIMFVLHLIAMYILMYAMVDRFANVYPSHNQLYMAALMASPMVALELLLMWSMYPKRAWNIGLIIASVALLAASFFFIRAQTAIGDEQFLRSMIPHHAGAILMCNEASLTDPEILDLCATIVEGQQAEIDLMKAKLTELGQ